MSSYQCAPSLSTAVLTNSLWLAYKLTSALSSIQQMAAASSPARSGNLPTCDLACHVSAVTCLVSRYLFPGLVVEVQDHSLHPGIVSVPRVIHIAAVDLYIKAFTSLIVRCNFSTPHPRH